MGRNYAKLNNNYYDSEFISVFKAEFQFCINPSLVSVINNIMTQNLCKSKVA